MTEATDRPWVVEYRRIPIHLTTSEYVALKAAALDDPVKAQEMADEFLRREVPA